MLKIKMGIDLCRGDAGVTKHLLHRPQVARRLQHMRSEGMAQHVRMDVAWHPGTQGLAGEAQLDRPMAEARTAAADE